MSNERIARILNGSIVVIASGFSIVEPRFAWLVLFMGASLAFSGAFNFCGFQIILDRVRIARGRVEVRENSR